MMKFLKQLFCKHDLLYYLGTPGNAIGPFKFLPVINMEYFKKCIKCKKIFK